MKEQFHPYSTSELLSEHTSQAGGELGLWVGLVFQELKQGMRVRVKEVALRGQEQKENESNIQRAPLTHQVQRGVVGEEVKVKQ